MRCRCGRFVKRDHSLCLRCKEDDAWNAFIADNPLDQMFYEDEAVRA